MYGDFLIKLKIQPVSKGEQIMLEEFLKDRLKKNLIGHSKITINDFIKPGIFNTPETPYYLDEFEKNLIAKMSAVHFAEYSDGNGKEFIDKETPAKMKSLHSSSALTFNLLGNDYAIIKPNKQGIDPGKYNVQYEKKLETLVGTIKANLDACLLSIDKSNVVFCEMKMFEWLSKRTASVSKSYQESTMYHNHDAFKVFSVLFKLYEEPTKPNKLTPYRYDAPQMLKHSLGIYNTFADAEKNKEHEFYGVKKVTLLNCVWEVCDVSTLGDLKNNYIKIVNNEHDEFQSFKLLYQPIINLFKNKLNIDLQLCYLTHKEFIDILDKNPQELDYLQRYCI